MKYRSPKKTEICTPEIRAAVEAYIMGKAFARMERKRVDAYVLPIWESYDFRISEDMAGGPQEVGEKLKNPGEIYLAGDDIRVDRFFEECREAHIANGWKGPRDQCPALVAEHQLTKLEAALIDVSAKPFKMCDQDFWERPNALENRKAWIDNVCGLIVSTFKLDAEKIIREAGR